MDIHTKDGIFKAATILLLGVAGLFFVNAYVEGREAKQLNVPEKALALKITEEAAIAEHLAQPAQPVEKISEIEATEWTSAQLRVININYSNFKNASRQNCMRGDPLFFPDYGKYYHMYRSNAGQVYHECSTMVNDLMKAIPKANFWNNGEYLQVFYQ